MTPAPATATATTGTTGTTTAGRRRRWLVGTVILAALGYLLFQGLGNATVYFKTADEAVAERTRLGTRRFRLEGLVVPGSLRPAGSAIDFSVRGDGGAVVDVVHDGTVPELFRADIPVVMEGSWDGDHYRSDRIFVRHTSEYRAKNPERVTDYTAVP